MEMAFGVARLIDSFAKHAAAWFLAKAIKYALQKSQKKQIAVGVLSVVQFSALYKIMGMNPKASFGNFNASSLRGIIPSAARDCFPENRDNSNSRLQCTAFLKFGSH